MTIRARSNLWFALFGGALIGVLTVAQSHTNGALGRGLGDGYVAAAFSFIVGLLILAVAVLLTPAARNGTRDLIAEVRSGHLPWWALTGGLCGAFFVLSQGIAAGVIGIALFTVGTVAGQIFGGLVIDQIGVGPNGRISPNAPRVIGTVLVIAAVALSVIGDLSGIGPAVAMVLVPLISGALLAWQAAVNGLTRAVARSAIAAAFVNFVVGTVAICLAAAVSVSFRGWPEAWPTDLWVYLGAPLGVGIVWLLAVFVRFAGVLVLSVANVAGQLLTALVFEAVVPLAGGVTSWMLLGTAVALVAVGIASLPGRRRSV